MRRCIQLALLGEGNVAPNPMVGAVLVHNNRIIGEGYHKKYGEAHAEVNCVQSVAAKDIQLISDSTLYVSLEPCSHFGKTPPCADMIVREKIKKVVISCIDTSAKVNGKGVKKLQDNGVNVVTGICEDECRKLNRRFFTYNQLLRPYIILKWAESANEMIGKESERIHISNRYTNTIVHQWRSHEAAILIGRNAARIDNPLLTNRYGSGKNPLRIILAGQNPPDNLKMYHEPGKTIVFNHSKDEEDSSVEYVRVEKDKYLETVMNRLYQSKIQSVLVEGGAYTLQQFLDRGLWDECRIITNTGLIIPGGIPGPAIPRMQLYRQEQTEQDLIQYYHNPHNELLS